MQDWLAQRTHSTPDRLALVFGDQRWSYAELDAWTSELAAYLQKQGVQPGQRVGVLLPNQPIFVVLIHALARLGAIQVPFNTRLTQEELNWQIENASCDLLLVSERNQDINDGVQDTVLLQLDELPRPPIPNPQSQVSNSRFSFPDFAPSSAHAIFFTSGTTGKPKGARLTFGNHLASASASAYRLGVLPDDCWLLCMPLYHIGGQAIVLRSCLYGTAVELQDGFDVDAVYESMMSGQTTLASLVPTMLHRIFDKFDIVEFPDALRCILLGGAPAAEQLISSALELNLPIALTYGLTEAGSQVATASPETVRQKPGSVGKPLMFTQIKIQDKSGKQLGVGEIGEVIVSGPTVMQGYDGQPDAHGRINTGDLGYRDADGDLWVVNRRDDLIVSGGENIYPSEVETALLKHPLVIEACVIGLSDAEWGQRVAAAIVADGLREAELLDFARQDLAAYKLPRSLVFTSHLPRTASGKVLRDEVRVLVKKELMVAT